MGTSKSARDVVACTASVASAGGTSVASAGGTSVTSAGGVSALGSSMLVSAWDVALGLGSCRALSAGAGASALAAASACTTQ